MTVSVQSGCRFGQKNDLINRRKEEEEEEEEEDGWMEETKGNTYVIREMVSVRVQKEEALYICTEIPHIKIACATCI